MKPITDAELEKIYTDEFNRRQPDKSSKWFYTWDVDGSFDVCTREKLIEAYVRARLQKSDADFFIDDYMGESSFSRAKAFVVMALTGCRRDIALGLQDARGMKKPQS